MRRACNVFIQVVLGPSLIYFFLLGHVAYQIYKDPDELKTQAWPAHTTKAEKEAIIKGRKPLINGILDLAGKRMRLVERHCIWYILTCNDAAKGVC